MFELGIYIKQSGFIIPSVDHVLGALLYRQLWSKKNSPSPEKEEPNDEGIWNSRMFLLANKYEEIISVQQQSPRWLAYRMTLLARRNNETWWQLRRHSDRRWWA
jgi:hypothetical protein